MSIRPTLGELVRTREEALFRQAFPTRYQVVESRGECPNGYRVGDVVTVDAGGAVDPQLCPPAKAVLRAAAWGEAPEVDEWCCPIFDHMLVFRRQL